MGGIGSDIVGVVESGEPSDFRDTNIEKHKVWSLDEVAVFYEKDGTNACNLTIADLDGTLSNNATPISGVRHLLNSCLKVLCVTNRHNAENSHFFSRRTGDVMDALEKLGFARNNLFVSQDKQNPHRTFRNLEEYGRLLVAIEEQIILINEKSTSSNSELPIYINFISDRYWWHQIASAAIVNAIGFDVNEIYYIQQIAFDLFKRGQVNMENVHFRFFELAGTKGNNNGNGHHVEG